MIPIDDRVHVGKNIHLDMVDARGHWEGDTLVVETTNFKERSAYRNANPDALKIVERFARIAPDKVRWAVTVEDSTTWTRPWTISMPLTLTDTEPIMQYECHEGNYGLRNILSAARAEEKAVSQAGESLTPLDCSVDGDDHCNTYHHGVIPRLGMAVIVSAWTAITSWRTCATGSTRCPNSET